MSSHLTCDNVRNLLPLYADDLLTEPTRRDVEEHLESCPGCREVLNRLSAPDPVVTKEVPEVDYFKKVKKNRLRIILCAAALLFMAVIFPLIGLFSHRDEPEPVPAKDRAALSEAMEKVPDAVVPDRSALDAGQEKDVLYTGGHGSSAAYSGYGICWQGRAADQTVEYELLCLQSGERTGFHELYRDVFLENSRYGTKDSLWPVTLRFTLGSQVYTLHGRHAATLSDAERKAVEQAMEQQLRQLAERLIDQYKDA